MESRFPSRGPVWGAPRLLAADDLRALTRDELVHVYNAEMRRTSRPALTSTWDSRPKARLVELLATLRDAGAPLALERLRAESRPVLAAGTRLRSGSKHSFYVEVQYAVVLGETPGGAVKLGLLDVEDVGFVPAPSAGAASLHTRRVNLDAPHGFKRPLAAWRPCERSGTTTNGYWTLVSGQEREHDARTWVLCEQSGIVEWTFEGGSA